MIVKVVNPPTTEAEKESLGCHLKMIPVSEMPDSVYAGRTTGFALHCSFPGRPEFVAPTKRFVQMNPVCTNCLCNKVKELFQAVDRELLKERLKRNESRSN